MDDRTLLERWANDGLPAYSFSYPSFIKLDVQQLLRAIIDHVNGVVPTEPKPKPFDEAAERERMANLRTEIEGLKSGKA